MTLPARPDLPRYLTPRECSELCGYKRTSLYRLEQNGEFPRRYRLGINKVGWLESEVRDWLISRPRITPTTTSAAGPQ